METVVLIGSESMGTGDAGLGARLLGNFLRTLPGVEPRPSAIIFYNGGVRLLARGSPLVDALRELDEAGVELLACVTCLEFFSLLDHLAVGQVSNMREIATRLMRADKTVTV